MKPAVLLLSGGLDSITAGAIARQQGFEIYALSVDYGQRHRFELEAARRAAAWLGTKQHRVVHVGLDALGGSALTDAIAVPKDRPQIAPHEFEMSDADTTWDGFHLDARRQPPEPPGSIPITYVPARNTVFLALSLAYAEVIGAADIFLGVNAIDYSGYPDCRPAFLDAFARLADVATKAGVEGRAFQIHAPLVHMTKAQIIRHGVELGIDYGITHSCYDPNSKGVSCGHCDACLLRRAGFAEAGLKDPLPYQA